MRTLMDRLACVPLALCGVLLATACVSMPSEGPVIDVDTDVAGSTTPGIDYDPQPPQEGEPPAKIVAGFMEAMKAKPSRTNVASEFLTASARQRWSPENKIITYAELGDPDGGAEVKLSMADIEEYDARGAWQRSRKQQVSTFNLTTEDGEWRIDELPDALIVPEAWFEEQFRRMSLYFFDPTAQILVPEPVYVPDDSEKLASSLVGGLLSDPSSDARMTRTFVPPGFTYRTSVPITSAGVAEVSLVGDAAAVDDLARQRILTQLIWTMRQEPRIRAVQLSIGEEQDVPGEVTQVNLDVGDAFDPSGAQSSGDLFGLVDGRLVRGSIDALQPTAGPFGAERLGVRSIGVNLAGDRVAGVSGNGRSLLVAPVDVEGRAVQVASDARDLLPPAWDFEDRIWLADRTVGGAAISVVVGDQSPRLIDVPGISGRDVRHLLVSRDGSRLVAVVSTPKGDRIVASRILHSEGGRVLRATRAVRLDFDPDRAKPLVRDIAWRSPTTISVLTDFTEALSQVETLSVDGAPGEISIEGASRLRGGSRRLVSSPVLGAEVFAVGNQTASDLTAPERPVGPLPDGLTSLTYVG